MAKEIEFVDLKTQYADLKASIDARIQRVLDHGQFILGPEVRELEEQLTKYTRRTVHASLRQCSGQASPQHERFYARSS